MSVKRILQRTEAARKKDLHWAGKFVVGKVEILKLEGFDQRAYFWRDPVIQDFYFREITAKF